MRSPELFMAHQTAAEAHRYPQQPDLDDPRGPDFLVFIYGGGFLDKDDQSKFRAGFSTPARCATGVLLGRSR